MPADHFTDDELSAWLDEMLPVERMTAIEAALRSSAALRRRLQETIRRRDQGAHSVGEIWRSHRLSCLSRQQLKSYLLGTADGGLTDYVAFHLQTVGCRLCAANLQDLQQQAASERGTQQRRRRFFRSSAGLLPK